MSQAKTPLARLREAVYQEGQRAYRSGDRCPYTDWRATTWAKGRAAAQEYCSAPAEPERPAAAEACPCCGRPL